MEEFITRVLENLNYRVAGPMHFRIYLQPLIASVFAVIAGIRDAKLGRPSHFRLMLSDSAHRAELMRDGWRSIGRVFIFAAVLDIIYQFIVERFVYPLEVLITALVLALLPFLIVRAIVSHIAWYFVGGEKNPDYATDDSKQGRP